MTRWIVPRAAVVAAAALVCVCLLTAWVLPLFDPDEGYYPATAAESLDAGTSWDLQFNGEPRWDKPVLSYALIQSAFAILGRSAGAARVPSALEGAALVLATGALVNVLAGPGAGALSAVVLSTTVGVQVFSRAAHPEIALALSIGVTQLLLVSWLLLPADGPAKAGPYVRGVRLQADRGLRADRWLPILIGLSMGYGLLAKGPVAVAVPAVGVLVTAPFVLERSRWRAAIRDAIAAGLVSLIVAAPWYVAMTLRHGAGFLRDALWQQNVARYTGQLAVHASQSPVYYVLPAVIAMLPWTALAIPAILRVRRPHDSRTRVTFCVAMMAAATFGFYSLSASKLASYILALVPSISVLIGMYLDEVISSGSGEEPWPFHATSAILVLTSLALIAIVVADGRVVDTRELTGGVPGADARALLAHAAVLPVLVLVAGGVLVTRLRGVARVHALAAVGACVPLVVAFAGQPLVADAYPWRQFAARIAQDPGPIWVDSYRTPSLTFYAGRSVGRLADDNDLAGVVAGGDGWLIVPQERTTTQPLLGRIHAGRASIAARAGSAVLVRLTSQGDPG